MSTRISTLAPAVLEVTIDGRLEKQDYERFTPLAEERIERHGKISLLVHVGNMSGWSPKGLWEDLKFDAKHYDDIDRLAIVADSDDRRWMATLSKPLTKASVRFFTESEVSEARAWVQQSPEATATSAAH